jgi:uncharacterized protein (TIGR03032 family)
MADQAKPRRSARGNGRTGFADSTPSEPTQAPKLEITTSRQFVSWMAEQRVSFAFTTYQAGKLFLIGLKEEGRLSVFERTFERCMGLAAHDSSLYMASLYQLWRFNNVIPAGQTSDGYDRLYVPQVGWVTGDVDCHDVAIDSAGRPIFVNTLFSCLATVDESASFAPLWQPPFISKLAAEDRCHLNGLAMSDGSPRYVTAVSQTDVHEGWREHRREGGVVIDVQTNEVVCEGLSMPHSPRMHEGKLWLLDSGNGQFGFVDLQRKHFMPICFCPGYARGLAFTGHFAVIGLSKPRDENKTFHGLRLDDALNEKKVGARCGLQVVDLRTGDAVHTLTVDGVVQELYDVITLQGVVRPSALGFKTDEIRRVLSLAQARPLEDL